VAKIRLPLDKFLDSRTVKALGLAGTIATLYGTALLFHHPSPQAPPVGSNASISVTSLHSSSAASAQLVPSNAAPVVPPSHPSVATPHSDRKTPDSSALPAGAVPPVVQKKSPAGAGAPVAVGTVTQTSHAAQSPNIAGVSGNVQIQYGVPAPRNDKPVETAK
jgi:hypothetical protein